jgi:hypothetical protein
MFDKAIIRAGHALMFAAALSLAACNGSTPPATTPGTPAAGNEVLPGVINKGNALVQKGADVFLTDLTGILNASEPDLINAANAVMVVVPSTGQPLNAPLASCINNGVLAVKKDAIAIIGAAHTATAGAITLAAVSGSIQPGSKFYNDEKRMLLGACASVAVNMGLDVQSQLGQIVPVLAAPIAAAAGPAAMLAPVGL